MYYLCGPHLLYFSLNLSTDQSSRESIRVFHRRFRNNPDHPLYLVYGRGSIVFHDLPSLYPLCENWSKGVLFFWEPAEYIAIYELVSKLILIWKFESVIWDSSRFSWPPSSLTKVPDLNHLTDNHANHDSVWTSEARCRNGEYDLFCVIKEELLLPVLLSQLCICLETRQDKFIWSRAYFYF